MAHRLALVVLAGLLSGCASPGPSASPATQTASDGQFRLTTTVPRSTYHPGEAIDVTASLTYIGSLPQAVVLPTDMGLVTIWFKQLDGPLYLTPFSRLMCGREAVSLERDSPMTFKPVKASGYEPGTPTASFYLGWNADPLVHLPVGRWQIDAHLTTCGGIGPGDLGATADIDLTTPALIVTVTP